MWCQAAESLNQTNNESDQMTRRTKALQGKFLQGLETPTFEEVSYIRNKMTWWNNGDEITEQFKSCPNAEWNVTEKGSNVVKDKQLKWNKNGQNKRSSLSVGYHS